MQLIPLQATERQQFTTTLDNSRFQITLLAVAGIMYVTIIQDGNPIVTNSRCMPNYQLIPYRWMEGSTGNFSFQTGNNVNDYPGWQNFGVDQFLYYASAAELAAARNGDAPI
jgi:hypothetical protein